MYLPEDRHPLLYVYVDDDQPERIRSRRVSQGAVTVLGKWPEHLTISWMAGVIGLVSILTCFLLAIVFLLASSSSHHMKRALITKCERNEHVVQLIHMKNLEDLTVNENATYFVEIVTSQREKKETACSIESYLKQTTLPVFLVAIYTNNKSLENLTFCKELQQKFNNFKIIRFDMDSFFNKTVFANFQSQNVKFLTFLAKILVSWNVGGTVIDSQLKTLKDFQSVLKANDKTLTIGKVEEDVVLISAKRFCHVYIFDILRTITETKNVFQYTDVDIVKATQKRFCHGRWSCNAVKLLSKPEFCDSNTVNGHCTFMLSKPNKTQFRSAVNFTWENLCPKTKALLLGE